MRLAHFIGAGLALAIGYLIWRGSGSIWKAVLGGLIIPVIAFVLLGLLVGSDALESLSGPLLLALVVAVIAWLVWANRHT